MTELTISASEITEALRKHVTDFNPVVEAEQVGRVVEVGDGIAHVREVFFGDLHGEVRHFLDALQDVEAAAAAVALHGVGRIGHQLQLTQHKLGNHYHAVQEAGFGDVGDAAVDDDTGVQNLERFLR